ncbi:uncharacterized protein LOC135334340 [Halichondria panicea]|uniref:uncharacterized protein LOC135334340 n=1 Tax=Halichondria panicea TaxID=6063 RepID=UPI00312B6504
MEGAGVRAGNHIYIHHEAGGIFNKHGIVYKNDEEGASVAYYEKSLDSIVACSLENFANGNPISLYHYGVSYLWNLMAQKGSCSTRRYVLSRQEVVQNVFYYNKHLDEVQITHQNRSECFATACTSRTPLVVENPVFPATDDSIFRVYHLSHTIHPNHLKPGDHIYAYRKLRVYSHHGIYIGRNNSGVHIVIHFTGAPGTYKSKSTAKIRRASLDEFLDGADLQLVSYHENAVEQPGISHARKSQPAAEVIKMAEYYSMNPDTWGDYHLFNNNCEHFSIFCKTGEFVGINSDIQDQTKSSCTIQ